MKIDTFHSDYIPKAAQLFIATYQRQRLAVPTLPGTLANPPRLATMLTQIFGTCPGIMALEGDRLIGYMGWYIADGFRGTHRKGAYVPEWAHACTSDGQATIERQLYRAAAEQWAAAGCQVHAITLLAYNQAAIQTWFWNGFGLTVVDAVRPMRALAPFAAPALQIRSATPADARALAEIDAEHWSHYTRAPIFMPAHPPRDAVEHAEFLARPNNRIWLAEDRGVPVGFIRFDAYDFDGVAMVEADSGVAITGAYVRPAYRGLHVARALLDAGLRDFQAHGYEFCAVNFESFNPEASAFWMKYFEPVGLSLLRVPESV